jgi:hypothetical protein
MQKRNRMGRRGFSGYRLHKRNRGPTKSWSPVPRLNARLLLAESNLIQSPGLRKLGDTQ